MQVTISFTEALALATAREPLPQFARPPSVDGSVVSAKVELSLVPNAPYWVRILGVVDVTARLASYSDGVLIVVVTTRVRGLPAHKMLPLFAGLVADQLRQHGLPPGSVEVRRDDGQTVLAVHVQDVLDTLTYGVTLTDLRLIDETFYVAVTVGTVRLRQPAPSL